MIENLQPRLQGAISLHRRGRDWGFMRIKGRNSDVKGASGPKSEEEKYLLFERDRQIFKNSEKKLALVPRLENVVCK